MEGWDEACRAVFAECSWANRWPCTPHYKDTLAHTTLALSPGLGLGPFRLGQPLPEVLSLLRSPQLRTTFRCVEVKWPQGPGEQQGDLALCFPEHGMHLLFDQTQQRLRLIEVHDTTRLQVRFGSHVFGGAAHAPTFGRVCEAFGPTYPGEAAGGQYPLQYPGVLFLFPTAPAAGAAAAAGPALQQHLHLHPHHLQQQQQQRPRQVAGSSSSGGNSGGAGAAELPVPLSTPAVRIIVHFGTASSLAAARSAPPPPLPPGSTYWERVEAVPCQGLLLGSAGQLLRFGDSPQDVVSELGPPSSTHTKPARPGAAAAAAGGATGGAAAAAAPDYYFCYASRGLDVLFCGSSHQLKKLVLHANQPGHPDFGLYSRCNFRVHPAGSWSLPGSGSSPSFGGPGSNAGEEAGDSPLGTDASVGSDGGASMRTAVSEASLAATEVPAGTACLAVQPGPPLPAGAASPAAAAGASRGSGDDGGSMRAGAPQLQGQQGEGDARPASGLTAAYNSLVRLIDDVMHVDDSPSSGEENGSGGEVRDADVQAASQGGPEANEAAAASGAAGNNAAALGRPPRPPTSLPIPAPPAPAKASAGGGGSSKKKKKKEKRAAAAAAKLLAAGGGSAAEESANEGTDTDASFADSAPSSLASSPGMTSFLSSIAASGGTMATGTGRQGGGATAAAAGGGGSAGPGAAAAAAAAALASGYSSEGGSTVDFASKERRLENGSAYDGWSEADDLALLVGGEEAAAAPEPAGSACAGAGAGGEGGSSTGGGALPSTGQQEQQQERQRHPMRVSAAVQTAPAAEEGEGGLPAQQPLLGAELAGRAAAACAALADPDSPDSYVLADSPSLFDESSAAAEYESVPRQRSSGTQTQPHLLVGPPLRTSAAAGGAGSGAAAKLRRGAGVPAGAAAAAVGVGSTLADVQAAFGAGAKPALHTRLGGRHPFGPTHLFAYRGAVFEVLRNGCIATVTLFQA